jgi:hypothetical protein
MNASYTIIVMQGGLLCGPLLQYYLSFKKVKFRFIQVLSVIFIFVGFNLIGNAMNIDRYLLGAIISGLGFGIFTSNVTPWIISEAGGYKLSQFAINISTFALYLGFAILPFGVKFFSHDGDMQNMYLKSSSILLLLSIIILLKDVKIFTRKKGI